MGIVILWSNIMVRRTLVMFKMNTTDNNAVEKTIYTRVSTVFQLSRLV